MSIFREFNINMIPGKPPLIIHVSQYESDFVYTFNLVSGKSVLAIPNTAIAVIRGTKRDGNGYSVEAALDAENHKVVVMGDPQLTACAGRNVFELAIINDEKVICTANFFLDVERAPLDSDTIRSETVLHDLQAIINSAATATQAAEEASAAQETVIDILESGVEEAVDNWLDEHPEATTTVLDGAITEAKLATALKPKVIKDYVTPQMYGAVGDGVTDDTQSFQDAINAVALESRQALFIPDGIYLITDTLNVTSRMVIFGDPHTDTSTRILLGSNVKKAFNVTGQLVGFYNFNIIGTDTTDCVGIDYNMPSDVQYNCDGQVYGMTLYELAVGVKLSGRNLAVKNSMFSHCGYGIYCEVTNATRTATFRGLFVDSNRFHNCGENENYSDDTACVYYNSELSTQTHSFYIVNNYCDLGTRLFKGSLQGGCISNNYIVYIQTDAIWVVNDSSTTYKGTETPLISNNYMEHHGTNSDVAIICDYVKRICISNNYAFGFGGGIIRCNSSTNVTIDGIFYRGRTENPAIYLVGCTNISIRNIVEFYISNQNAVSIRCENSSGTVVSADIDNTKVLGAIEYLNKATQYTYTSGNVSFVYSLYKSGNVVELNCINGTVPAQSGGPENPLFTLPDKFHPVSNVNFKDTNSEQRFTINTDGELYLNSATTTVSALRGTFVYMAR